MLHPFTANQLMIFSQRLLNPMSVDAAFSPFPYRSHPFGQAKVKTFKADANSVRTGRDLDARCIREIIRAACSDNSSAFHRDRTLDDVIEFVGIEYRLPLNVELTVIGK